uniref:RING-type E3 ubiquitin transferase n=1 Tax=Romanomermis culicivorax TaxID=13658 RepID=A0A915IT19_ROMCU
MTQQQKEKSHPAKSSSSSPTNLLPPPSPQCCRYFNCYICLDSAQSPVITLCGHLFCWPCLYVWFLTHERNLFCPSCRCPLLRSHIVPVIEQKFTKDGNGEKNAGVGGLPPRPKPFSQSSGFNARNIINTEIFQWPNGERARNSLCFTIFLSILWYLFA